jgi:hypothetical protein
VSPRVAVVGLVALPALWLVATVLMFVSPSLDAPARADAVVVFGAEISSRLDTGLRLTEQGVAPTLVLTVPDGWNDGAICSRPMSVEIVCVNPDPPTTRGDARVTGTLAEERGWESVALVTSDYHALRARLLLERCYDGSVEVAADGQAGELRRKVSRIAHEWGGLVQSLVWARSC